MPTAEAFDWLEVKYLICSSRDRWCFETIMMDAI
jgi:hypothetical protein